MVQLGELNGCVILCMCCSGTGKTGLFHFCCLFGQMREKVLIASIALDTNQFLTHSFDGTTYIHTCLQMLEFGFTPPPFARRFFMVFCAEKYLSGRTLRSEVNFYKQD